MRAGSPCAGSSSGTRRTGCSSSATSFVQCSTSRWSHALARVEVEPALPALLLRAGCPRRSPRACRRPPGSSSRYCCSGVTPNSVGHRVLGRLAVGPVGADEVASRPSGRSGSSRPRGEAARRRSRRARSSRPAPASRGRGASRASAGSPRRGTPRRCARRRTSSGGGPVAVPCPGGGSTAGSPRPRAPPGPRPAGQRARLRAACVMERDRGPRQRLRIRISVPPFSNDTSSISWLIR